MNDASVKKLLQDIKSNIKKKIIGKDAVIDEILICLLCGGHALIEDVPGLGKTTLISALASSISCSFQRMQFTPDILPSDITGFHMFQPQTGEQPFFPGAVMNNILLADEINRTGPKTQAALLQAMQEGEVTVDGETFELPAPFLVFATQNPVEMTGTYPLPEAQLDRFLLRISMGYPEKDDEIEILEANQDTGTVEALSAVCSLRDALELQKALNGVKCVRRIKNYIVEIARETRKHKEITLGLSPRGSIALMRAAMGRAMLSGRDYVLPEDVQQMAPAVISHRLMIDTQAYLKNTTAAGIVASLLKHIPVPGVSRA